MSRFDLLMLYKRLRYGWAWACSYPSCSHLGRKTKSFMSCTSASHNGRAHMKLIHNDFETEPIVVRMYKTVVCKDVS